LNAVLANIYFFYFRLAVGTFSSIYVVDMMEKECIFNMNTASVLRSIDKRVQIKSPTLLKPGILKLVGDKLFKPSGSRTKELTRI